MCDLSQAQRADAGATNGRSATRASQGPFTYVGLDVFGLWYITTRRTRGAQSESKQWAILFCCMSSRAVHIEVIASMDASSCINAMRRFFAIRGPAKQLRSDCGTNFIGACRELRMSADQPPLCRSTYTNKDVPGCLTHHMLRIWVVHRNASLE